MADPLSQDLDELGGLVGQSLNIFENSTSPGVQSPAPQHPLDPFGTPGSLVGQSIDLDLLTSASAGPAQVVARSNTANADTEILLGDDLQLGFGHQQLQTQSTPPAGPPGLSEPLADTSQRGRERSSPRALDEGPSTSTGEGAGPAEAADDRPAVRVWIRESEKVEGINKLGIRTAYFTFVIRTESQLASLQTDGTEVRRRFSEFDALHKLLKVGFRGYIIPPLPEKSFIDAKLGHDDFLRLRRADLQAFLRGVVSHHALRESEAVRLFLLQPGELQYNPAWIALMHTIGGGPDGQEGLVGSLVHGGLAVGGSGATAKAAAGLSNLVNWVRHSVLVPGGRRELDEDERQLRQAKELMRDLERLLQLCCEAARVMCSHMESMASDMYELGRNMGMLSKWEETLRAHSGSYTEAGYSASKRAADCKQLSYASARQHNVWKTASVKTAASLVSLHDYCIIMPEAVAALEERERCLDQIQALEADLQAKHAELHKAQGKGPAAGRERKAYTLTSSVERLEEQLRTSRETYLLIKQRNMEELRRLHLAREQDFHKMMAHFATVQAQLLSTSADMWRTAARQFAGEPAPPAEPVAEEPAEEEPARD